MDDVATFHAVFDEASVTIKVDYPSFSKSKNVADILKAEWEGKPTSKIFPQYISRMHTVMVQIAQRTNQRIFYAYPSVGGQSPQYYVYFENGKFEKVQSPK